MHNVVKWPNIILKSCGVNTARFLKCVWPFYNMHERAKNRFKKIICIDIKCIVLIRKIGISKVTLNGTTSNRGVFRIQSNISDGAFLQNKIFSFLMFSGGIERGQWHEMGEKKLRNQQFS